MRIIIAGGTGMIGRPLVKELADCGHQILVITRKTNRVHSTDQITYIPWLFLKSEKIGNEFSNVDAVINLAGENLGSQLWSQKRKNALISSRVEASNKLVDAIKNHRISPKVFIQASAIGYYGKNIDLSITEDDKPGADFLSEICLRWETTSQPVENLGIRRLIIRTGVVLSPDEGAFKRLLLPIRLFVGGPLGTGAQQISWIHLKDELAAIQFLLENENCQGIFNLTAPNPLSNKEIGKMLAGHINRPYWLPTPGFLLRLVLGEMSDVVLDSQKVLPKRLLEAGFSFKYPDFGKALESF